MENKKKINNKCSTHFFFFFKWTVIWVIKYIEISILVVVILVVAEL